MDTINYEQFAQEIQQKKESTPELRDAPHQEIISNILHEHRAQVAQTNAQQISQSQSLHGQQTSSDDHLASYAKDAPQDAKQKTKELIQYTFAHGIRAGISKAIHEDPFVLDLYHDTLTEKLLEEMKSRNLL